MSQKKLLAWLIVNLFIIFGFVYTVAGFGRSVDIHEGQAGLYKADRNRSIRPAQKILAGDLSFYQKELRTPFLSEVGRGYTYPPAMALTVLPLVYVSQQVGMSADDLFEISILPFIFLTGLGVFFIAAVYEKYTEKETPDDAIALIAIFLFSGMLFYSAVKAGKFEGVIALFVLLGMFFLPKKRILSGICFGLAICTKQTAILFMIPAFLVLCQEKNYRQTLAWIGAMSLTVFLMLLPFVWVSGLENVYIALLKNFDLHKIQSHTTVGYLYAAIKLFVNDSDGTINLFLQHNANKFVLMTCVIVSAYLVWKRKITLQTPEQYFALTVFCSFFYIIGGKWYTSGIYEVAPTYFFVLWAIVSGQTVFAAIMLLTQSFLCCNWPVALYRDQLLLLLYYGVTFYVLRVSLASDTSGKRESPA